MIEKPCYVCNNTKPLSEFSKHSGMKDGHLNKCKECANEFSKKFRKDNVEYYREYDRKRGNRQGYEYTKQYRENNPKKYKATNLVNYHIKMGLINKQPCEICGKLEKVHAHHDDYNLPLNIRWLCPEHHRQWHISNSPKD